MFNFLFKRTEKDTVEAVIDIDIDKNSLKEETIKSIVEKSRNEAEKDYKQHLKYKLINELYKKYNIVHEFNFMTNGTKELMLVDAIIEDMIIQLGLIEDKGD